MNLRPYLQFNRRISRRLTLVFARFNLSPNFVTSLALMTGLAAGFTASLGGRSWLITAVFFLHLSFILDNCDGELARLQSRKTAFGKWYDILSDLFVELCLWVGLAFGSLNMGEDSLLVPLTVFACVGSCVNGFIVVRERRMGLSTSIHAVTQRTAHRKKSIFFSILDTLSHNGDSIVLVWVLAFVGHPWFLLCLGCCFINGLWMMRIAVNARRLLFPLR